MTKEVKLLIILTAVALILGGLVYASARYNIKAVSDAISAIGKPTYSEESRGLIDAADERISGLDPNLHLDEKIENLDALKSAKVTYVEQAIIRLYRAIRDKQDEAVIRQDLADAEEAFSSYLTEADIPLVHNYRDLADAREKYGEKNSPAPVTELQIIPSQPVEIDLCGV